MVTNSWSGSYCATIRCSSSPPNRSICSWGKLAKRDVPRRWSRRGIHHQRATPVGHVTILGNRAKDEEIVHNPGRIREALALGPFGQTGSWLTFVHMGIVYQTDGRGCLGMPASTTPQPSRGNHCSSNGISASQSISGPSNNSSAAHSS